MDLLVVTNFLNSFFMIALPIALGVFLIERFQLRWKLWLIGAMAFILSQVPHFPISLYLQAPLVNPILQSFGPVAGTLIIGIVFGLSAGVFEESARYVMFRWFLKDNHNWPSAIVAGAGHAGAEAILLGLYVLWVFINMLAVRNADLSKLNLPPDQLAIALQQIKAYWGIPWYQTLLPLVERIFTIPFHIMASVVVLQVFTRRPGKESLSWLGLAIFFHTMMSTSSVFVLRFWGAYAAEAVLGGLAIMDVIIIFALRQPEPKDNTTKPGLPSTESRRFKPQPVEETSENLEKTRYQ